MIRILSKKTILLFLSLSTLSVNAEEILTRIGYAHDKSTSELVYTENHYEKYTDGMILKSRVVYKDTSDNVFAEKTVDFTNNKFMPEFSLNNSANGHKEETRYKQSQYEVVFSETKTGPEKDALLSYPEDGISDAGFDNFIIEHWDELVSGEVFKREFLIPSMMDFIKFKIYQDDVVDEEGESLRLINIEPANFLIRAFAGTTKLYYDTDAPKLRRFDGVSNMRDAKGDNYKVVIKYRDGEQQLAVFD